MQLLKTYLELHGLSCIELFNAKPLQSIIHSRNFSKQLLNFSSVLKELKTFTRDLTHRLREHSLKAQKIHLKISSSPFRSEPIMHEEKMVILPEPTNYNPILHKACQEALESIYTTGMQIKRMCLTYNNLINEKDFSQKNLLEPTSTTQEKNQHKLMKIMDSSQARYSKNALFLASESPVVVSKANGYTTKFAEILNIDMDKHFVL